MNLDMYYIWYLFRQSAVGSAHGALYLMHKRENILLGKDFCVCSLYYNNTNLQYIAVYIIYYYINYILFLGF